LKRGLALLAVALVALMFQGAVASVVPARFVPDLGLLLVFGVALAVRSPVEGVALTGAVGYGTDLLSGGLLGQHVLLRMAAYGASRVGGARLNLRGALPRAVFVFFLTLGHAVGLWLLSLFFSPDASRGLMGPGTLLTQAAVNALLAPLCTEAIAGLSSWLSEDEAGRPMRLEPRSFVR
jgi:cell shape-determining protein MreD